MRAVRFAGLPTLVLALLPVLATAQREPDPGYAVTLERLNGPAVYPHELLRLRIRYRSAVEDRFNLPIPAERYVFEGFEISPAPDGCGTRDFPCLWTPCFGGDCIGSDPLESMERTRAAIETDLNTYAPVLAPGEYQVRAVMAKQQFIEDAGRPGRFEISDPPEYLLSNPVEFEVREATPETAAAALAEAVAAYRAGAGVTEDPERNLRARRVAAINTNEARAAALRLFGETGQADLLAGLLDIPADEACDLMRSEAADPGQTLTYRYAVTARELCLQSPEVRSRIAEAAGPTPDASFTPEQIAREVMQRLAGRITEETGAGPARRMRHELLAYGASLEGPPPSFVERAARDVLAALPQYPPEEIGYTLDNFWEVLEAAGPQMARAALDGVIAHEDGWSRWTFARRAALKRLVELDSEAGQTALLAELRAFRPTLDEFTLPLLPPEAVPPMDDALLRYWAQPNRLASLDPSIARPAPLPPDPELLIARYATPAIADQVRRALDAAAGYSDCNTGLIAYFLRVDPEYAARALHRPEWNMQRPIEHCTFEYLNRLPELAMGPEVEQMLIAHLQHMQVPVKWAASQELATYGSAAAKQPLIAALRYFHDYWVDRVEELVKPSYEEGRLLETSLVYAIFRGNWEVSDEEAAELDGYCITNRCRTLVRARGDPEALRGL